MLWQRMKEAFGATDEGVAAFEKAEQLVGGTGDADAHAFAEGARRMADFAEPESFVFAEIHAVVAATDLQSLRKAAWTAREVQEHGGFAMALHHFNSSDGFESANQNGGGSPGRFADDVEHEVRAVVEENVDVAGSEIHGLDARRGAAKMMTRGIARRIGFGLDDAAADAPGREFVHDDFADEETRELDGVRRKLGTANPANGEFRRLLEGGLW